MEFAPGGANIAHPHEMEEEIYFVLRGSGDMVGGGGADGNEGRYPAQSGDDLVLAVRSSFPFPRPL